MLAPCSGVLEFECDAFLECECVQRVNGRGTGGQLQETQSWRGEVSS